MMNRIVYRALPRMPPLQQHARFLNAIPGTKAEHRDKELRERYNRYLDNYDEEVHRKKLIYRSKQRGWLEVDLLLGTWATENIPKLSIEELKDYEKILNLETIEIFYALSKPEKEVPENIKSKILTDLRLYAKNNPFKIEEHK